MKRRRLERSDEGRSRQLEGREGGVAAEESPSGGGSAVGAPGGGAVGTRSPSSVTSVDADLPLPENAEQEEGGEDGGGADGVLAGGGSNKRTEQVVWMRPVVGSRNPIHGPLRRGRLSPHTQPRNGPAHVASFLLTFSLLLQFFPSFYSCFSLAYPKSILASLLFFVVMDIVSMALPALFLSLCQFKTKQTGNFFGWLFWISFFCFYNFFMISNENIYDF
jgi:hypothetical protein